MRPLNEEDKENATSAQAGQATSAKKVILVEHDLICAIQVNTKVQRQKPVVSDGVDQPEIIMKLQVQDL